jgi:predicted transposase/invertase (TIGR01784 family)
MAGKLIRFDWAVKKLLRSKANFGILEGFLSELLKKDIKIQNIIESEGNQETEIDKYNRVDVVVKDESDEIILIEIQVNREADFLSRMLYGTSKVITEYISKGDPYQKVKKVYSVNILYFDLGHGDDYIYYGSTSFIGVHKKDELKLSSGQKEVYKRELVSHVYPEYYIIKLNQFNDVAKDPLDEWIYFLKNEDVPDNFTAKGLSEAKEKLDSMKLPKDEQARYKRFLENLHYEASMVETGKIEGRIEMKYEIARNMKDLNVDVYTIIKATGLTREKIEKL